MKRPKIKVEYIKYPYTFEGGITEDMYQFYINGVWDEDKHVLFQAKEAYPPKDFKWIEIEDQ